MADRLEMYDGPEPSSASSPRDDLRDDPLAWSLRPPKYVYLDVSLQQYAGTDLVRWYGARNGRWWPHGPLMRIVADTEAE